MNVRVMVVLEQQHHLESPIYETTISLSCSDIIWLSMSILLAHMALTAIILLSKKQCTASWFHKSPFESRQAPIRTAESHLLPLSTNMKSSTSGFLQKLPCASNQQHILSICPVCLESNATATAVKNLSLVQGGHCSVDCSNLCTLCKSLRCSGGRTMGGTTSANFVTQRPLQDSCGPCAVANMKVYPYSGLSRRERSGGNGVVTNGTTMDANGIFHDVVIKEAPKGGAFCEVKQQALRNEILKLLALPPHENVVRILGFSIGKEGEEYLVTEMMWSNLYDVVRGNPEDEGAPKVLTQGNVLRIVLGVVKGLLHLQNHDMIHNDLKPANILLDQYMHPKICDFGSCNYLKPWCTQAGRTLDYLAPECRMCCYDDRDTRAEIYSLGLVMLECVEVLGKADNGGNLEGDVVYVENCPVAIRTTCQRRLTSLIQECLDVDPKCRPTLQKIEGELQQMMYESLDKEECM